MRSVVPTVLVVDDDEVVLALMARVLAAEGYNVLTAGSGVEALAIARARLGQLPLVVTDLQMPEMNGIELAAHLARLTPAPRVLFVSGYAVTSDGELPGPFVPKPFVPDRLAHCVRRMLDAPGSFATTEPSTM